MWEFIFFYGEYGVPYVIVIIQSYKLIYRDVTIDLIKRDPDSSSSESFDSH